MKVHINYPVKFTVCVSDCLFFANSCQRPCQVCSSFGGATPRGKVVETILMQGSHCGSLKSSNCCLAVFTTADGGEGDPAKTMVFLLAK